MSSPSTGHLNLHNNMNNQYQLHNQEQMQFSNSGDDGSDGEYEMQSTPSGGSPQTSARSPKRKKTGGKKGRSNSKNTASGEKDKDSMISNNSTHVKKRTVTQSKDNSKEKEDKDKSSTEDQIDDGPKSGTSKGSGKKIQSGQQNLLTAQTDNNAHDARLSALSLEEEDPPSSDGQTQSQTGPKVYKIKKDPILNDQSGQQGGQTGSGNLPPKSILKSKTEKSVISNNENSDQQQNYPNEVNFQSNSSNVAIPRGSGGASQRGSDGNASIAASLRTNSNNTTVLANTNSIIDKKSSQKTTTDSIEEEGDDCDEDQDPIDSTKSFGIRHAASVIEFDQSKVISLEEAKKIRKQKWCCFTLFDKPLKEDEYETDQSLRIYHKRVSDIEAERLELNAINPSRLEIARLFRRHVYASRQQKEAGVNQDNSNANNNNATILKESTDNGSPSPNPTNQNQNLQRQTSPSYSNQQIQQPIVTKNASIESNKSSGSDSKGNKRNSSDSDGDHTNPFLLDKGAGPPVSPGRQYPGRNNNNNAAVTKTPSFVRQQTGLGGDRVLQVNQNQQQQQLHIQQTPVAVKKSHSNDSDKSNKSAAGKITGFFTATIKQKSTSDHSASDLEYDEAATFRKTSKESKDLLEREQQQGIIVIKVGSRGNSKDSRRNE